MLGGAGEEGVTLEVLGRREHWPRAAGGLLRAHFASLCRQALGPSDYLAIAARFHTVFIEAVPRLEPQDRDAARRLAILIDTLYEARARLVVLAAAEPAALYPAGDWPSSSSAPPRASRRCVRQPGWGGKSRSTFTGRRHESRVGRRRSHGLRVKHPVTARERAKRLPREPWRIAAAARAARANPALRADELGAGGHETYFGGLQAALKRAGIAEPTLVVDRQRLAANIETVRRALAPTALALRVVAKSLQAPALLEAVLAGTNTNRLMVFNGVMLEEIAAWRPDADVLTGRPLPAAQVEAFVARHAADPAPAAHPQWLVDSPRRLAQYSAIACARGGLFRVSLEIDVGLHRGGLAGEAALAAVIDQALAQPLIEIAGLMGYDAHAAGAPSPAAEVEPSRRSRSGAGPARRQARARPGRPNAQHGRQPDLCSAPGRQGGQRGLHRLRLRQADALRPAVPGPPRAGRLHRPAGAQGHGSSPDPAPRGPEPATWRRSIPTRGVGSSSMAAGATPGLFRRPA